MKAQLPRFPHSDSSPPQLQVYPHVEDGGAGLSRSQTHFLSQTSISSRGSDLDIHGEAVFARHSSLQLPSVDTRSQ